VIATAKIITAQRQKIVKAADVSMMTTISTMATSIELID
jgi:hypothetical protein